MQRTNIGRLGFWGVSAALGAVSLLAGCGEVKSLGENEGGSVGTPKDESGGGAGASTAAGGASNGGTSSAGGAGEDSTRTPYPLAPSVPISRDCSCADETMVCNAASECVPRCDSGGHCARWRLDREVSDLYAEDGILFLLEGPTRDRLGNLLDTPQRLMRTDFTVTLPTSFAELPPSVDSSILGRWNQVTYVKAGGIYAVADGLGAMTRIPTPGAIYAATFAQGTLYFSAPGGIWEMKVDTETTPRHILDIDYGVGTNYANLVAGDTLWFQNGDPNSVCVLSSSPAGFECRAAEGGGFAFPRVVHGNDAFVADYHGSIFRERFAEDSLFNLYVRDQRKVVITNFYDVAYLNQRLYAQVDQERLISFSTEFASDPWDEVSPAVLAAASGNHAELGFEAGLVKFRVEAHHGVYWVQQLADPNVSRYAFFRLFDTAVEH